MKMKILIIHNKYQQHGGEQTVVDAQLSLFREKGHEVVYYERDNKEINKFNFFKKVSFIFETVHSVRTQKDIESILHSFKPDVAHVHNVFPLISPSVYRILTKRHIPIIQTIHNFRFLCPNGLFYTHGKVCERCLKGNTLHAIRWRCFRNSAVQSGLYAFTIGLHRKIKTFSKISCFITLNSFTSRKLIESKVADSGKIKLIPHCLNAPLPRAVDEPKKTDLVFVGRLSEEKGVQIIIDSLRFIPEICLHILGTGPMENELRRQAEEFGDRISFEGFITGEKKWDFLQNALAAVIPSVCYEQFSFLSVEGMAAGTAIIASNIGGLPSIIHDGENGLLFEPGNSYDLAMKIRKLQEDPSLAKQLGDNGRRMVESLYSPELYADKLISLYQELLSESFNQK